MDNLIKKTELIANVAIIIVAILLGIVLFNRYIISGPPRTVDSLVSTNQASAHPKIDLSGVDWSKSRKTLVLAMSSSCHFCTESAPFYRQLAQAHEGTQLIAVLPQPVEEGRRYVSTLGFQVDDVVQAPLNSINVNGTPTLMLVNREGAIMETWIGKLPTEKEVELLGELKANSSNN